LGAVIFSPCGVLFSASLPCGELGALQQPCGLACELPCGELGALQQALQLCGVLRASSQRAYVQLAYGELLFF
jgi:hypothetical protein